MKEILKELRIKNRLTQTAVAQKIGLSQGTYCQYENGTRSPDKNVLCKIAYFYGVTVDYLLDRDKMRDGLNDEVRMIVNKYEKLTDKQKAFINSAIDMFDNDDIETMTDEELIQDIIDGERK